MIGPSYDARSMIQNQNSSAMQTMMAMIRVRPCVDDRLDPVHAVDAGRPLILDVAQFPSERRRREQQQQHRHDDDGDQQSDQHRVIRHRVDSSDLPDVRGVAAAR
jgi:hypothetical protein